MKLAIDIGGSSLKYATIDDTLLIYEKGEEKVPTDSLEHLLELIETLIHRFPNIDGVAISLPGNINNITGEIFSGGALTYNNGINFYKAFKVISDLPVTIENDGKCAALAEAIVGNLKDYKDGIVLVLGTGIGGGIIKNHQLHKGKDAFAGEFSFMMMSDNKLDINNCWAMKASTTGLIINVAQLKGLNMNELTGKDIFRMINENDVDALKGFDQFLTSLAIGIFNLNAIYNPDRFLIGGGISKQPILIESLKRKMEELCKGLPFIIPSIDIDVCKYHNDSNLIGALINFNDLYLKGKGNE